MKFKILVLAIAISSSLGAQTTQRWIKLPRHGQAEINKSPLQNSANGGAVLRFTYETEPVRPLLKLINRSIPEANQSQENIPDTYDLGRSTINLEELFNEAEEIFENQSASSTEPVITASQSFSIPASAAVKLPEATATAVINASTTGLP